MISTLKQNINSLLLLVFIAMGLSFAFPASSGAQDLFKGSKGEACSAVGAASGGECDQDKLDK